jgi:hypothetical protein
VHGRVEAVLVAAVSGEGLSCITKGTLGAWDTHQRAVRQDPEVGVLGFYG